MAGHQWLYQRRPASYCSEYAVDYEHCDAGVLLHLRGRADGYDARQGMVEEIKTCRVAPATVPDAVSHLHMAQGRLYAAIIAEQEQLSALEVRLTWLNIDTQEEFSRSEHLSGAELAAFLRDTLNRFSGWLHVLARLRRERDTSLAQLTFPHGDFRRGQRKLAELTYKCIDQGGQLQLEAPTGIGKTAALLFAALKALAADKHQRVVFVTAHTVGRHAAQDTLAHFRAAGYRGTALSLTARDSICLSPGRACHAQDCPYANGYYDRLPEAMLAAIRAPSLTREDIETLARKFEVCPYQLSLDLLPWVDVVIADAHYVYSLSAILGAGDGQHWTILLDEAHNLPGRARAMYSASISKARLMAARRQCKGAALTAINTLNRRLLQLQKAGWQEADFDSREHLPDRLLADVQRFTSAVAEQMVEEPACLQSRPSCLLYTSPSPRD